ncbi:uncharacterized protein ACRADG_004770 [Cochliomyia hominivorax]
MDIKSLLLQSLSSKKPITASRRIYFGKSCFIIKYIVSGKILTIKSIKKIQKKHKKTWSQRIKQYQGIYKKYRKRKSLKETHENKNYSEKENSTLELNWKTKQIQTEYLKVNPSENKSITSQTPSVTQISKSQQTDILIFPPIEIKSVSTETEIITTVSTSQQSITNDRFNLNRKTKSRIPTLKQISKYSQTYVTTQKSLGVQCKEKSQIQATNTEEINRNSYAQVESDFITNNSTPLTNDNAGKDLDVIVYMLNEIGDIVINQNQLLNNNHEMMRHLMEINLLKKSKLMRNTKRSISIQTNSPVKTEKINNFSQTTNFTKSKRLSFLNKRKSQHK